MFRGLWKSLSHRNATTPAPAWLARILVFGAPIAVGVWVFSTHGRITAPDAVLGGLSLLAGALLAAFAQLAAWRLRLVERLEDHRVSEQADRDHLDETVSQLLTAAYISGLDALILVIALNVSVDKHGAVVGAWAAVVAALGLLVIVLFLIAVPRLYSAYVNTNKVRDALNGYHSER